MTDDAPGFAPLSSDDFDALLEGDTAADHLNAFLEKGYQASMARFKDAMGKEVPWNKTQAPTAPFSAKDLVPPPKRRVAEPPKKTPVSSVTSDIKIKDKEGVDIPLRPFDKKPVQQVSATVKESDKRHDAGHIKQTQKTTKEKAPVAATSEPNTPSPDSPDFKKVSGEFLEQKLKERQDKLGDVFKDKGTLS